MADDLYIGSEGAEPYEGEIAAHLASIGNDQLSWRTSEPRIGQLSLIKAATLLLEHATELVGAEAEKKFDQLPWWENCVWLPISFTPPAVLMPDADPTLLGSCALLVQQLDELQRLSPLSLGQTPDGYDAMRADFKAWYRSGAQITDQGEMIRWVWKALREGASEAIAHNAPLWGAP